MFSPEAVLERAEIASSNEISLDELTYHRLAKQYEFIAGSLSGLSQDFGRPLKILDIGAWRGDYVHFFTDLPPEVVGEVTAIDINPKKVKQALAQPCLQSDLATGRLTIMKGDGTNIPQFADQSFDFINNIEILVGLNGKVTDLVSEVNRLLVYGGRASFNIPDQRSMYMFGQVGEFAAKKKIKYSQTELAEIFKENFDGDVRIAWFGQMPIRVEGENTLLPYKEGKKPDHIILATDALTIRPVFSPEGNKQFNPYFWMPMVRKW